MCYNDDNTKYCTYKSKTRNKDQSCVINRECKSAKCTNKRLKNSFECILGYSSPMRLNSNGDVECASKNNKNCMWSSNCKKYFK